MANKVLHLFTAEYPYGFKSEPFLETEIWYLSDKFKWIYIYPNQKSEGMRVLPENCTVRNVNTAESPDKLKKIYLLIASPFTAAKVAGSEIKDKGWGSFWKYKKMYFDLLATQLFIYSRLKKNSILNSSDIYYDYWFIDSALTLSIAHKKGKISHLFIRAHRFDLYDEDWPGTGVPFRCFTYKHSNVISFISQSGKRYFEDKTASCGGSSKLKVSRLGINRNLINNLPQKKSSTFHLLSCSGVTERKQVLQIIELLKSVDISLKWTHFGDGPLFPELTRDSKLLPENITVELKGHCSNTEVLKSYAKEFVDGFISLSGSEGVPVSMMEAISFGIPILARNVGGISEIVNETTGVLINEHDDPQQKLNAFLNRKWDREAIIAFQHGNFDAKKNYTNFTKILCGEK